MSLGKTKQNSFLWKKECSTSSMKKIIIQITNSFQSTVDHFWNLEKHYNLEFKDSVLNNYLFSLIVAAIITTKNEKFVIQCGWTGTKNLSIIVHFEFKVFCYTTWICKQLKTRIILTLDSPLGWMRMDGLNEPL